MVMEALTILGDIKRALTSKEARPVIAKLGGAAIGGSAWLLAETQDALNQYPFVPAFRALAEQHPMAYIAAGLVFGGLAIWGFLDLASKVDESGVPDVSTKQIARAAKRGLNKGINSVRRHRQ